MPRSPFVLALLVCAAFPAGARAQGLYEPFPEPAPATNAQGFMDRMGVTVSAEQLERGRFLAGRIAPAPEGGASARAGDGSGAGIALVAALCGGLLAAGLLTLRPRL